MPGIESRRIGSCACVDGSHWRARCQRDGPPSNEPNASCRSSPPPQAWPMGHRGRRLGPDVAVRLAASDDVVVAYQARVRVLGVQESDPSLPRFGPPIADSPRAHALLSHRSPDGTIPLNPYAKFQGPHWTLVCLAQIDYPPGDPGLHPDQAPDRRLAVRPRAPAAAATVRVPGPARARPALRLAGGQRDLVGAAPRPRGRADGRMGRAAGRRSSGRTAAGTATGDPRPAPPRSRRRRSRPGRCTPSALRFGHAGALRPPIGRPSCCSPAACCGAAATAR